MFRRREKKYFPPGTFIPLGARLCAILHLCLAFSLILWKLGNPFLDELFEAKSHILLYEHVMGIKPEHNRTLFEALNQSDKTIIENDYEHLRLKLRQPFIVKLKKSLWELFSNTSSLKLAWLWLSVLLSIFLLLKIEGTKEVLWLLPLLAGAHFFTILTSHTKLITHEQRLFPEEDYLVKTYLNGQLSADIFKQKEELENGWNLFLSHEWASRYPGLAIMHAIDKRQLGEFAFNVARILAIKKDLSERVSHQGTPFKELMATMWSLLYVVIANFSSRRQVFSKAYANAK